MIPRFRGRSGTAIFPGGSAPGGSAATKYELVGANAGQSDTEIRESGLQSPSARESCTNSPKTTTAAARDTIEMKTFLLLT